FSVPVEAETARLFREALQDPELRACCAPGWDAEPTRLAGLLVAEAEGAVVHEALLSAADPALSPETRRLLAFGRDCGSGRLVRGLRALREAAERIDEALGECDLLATPTVPAPAFAWSERPPPDQAVFTAAANFGGHPAITVPIGLTRDGRPVGLHLIGRRGADWHVMVAASRIEARTRAHLPRHDAQPGA